MLRDDTSYPPTHKEVDQNTTRKVSKTPLLNQITLHLALVLGPGVRGQRTCALSVSNKTVAVPRSTLTDSMLPQALNLSRNVASMSDGAQSALKPVTRTVCSPSSSSPVAHVCNAKRSCYD